MPSDKRVQQRRNRSMKELRQQQQQKQRRQRRYVVFLVAALVIIVGVVLATTLTSSNNNKKVATGTSSTTAATATTATTAARTAAKVPCPAANGSSAKRRSFPAPPPMCINTAKTYTAHMLTDLGTITIKLLAKQNPVTVNNFVYLSLYHFYDGTIFHRVVTGFVDQGGDPTGTGTGGPGYEFDGGAPSSASVYTAGALAMANSGSPSTDGSQFFIVVGKGGSQLSPSYSYFGQVTGGMSIVNKINTDGSASSAGAPKVVHHVLKVTITES